MAIFEIGAWLLSGLCEAVVDLVVVEVGVEYKAFVRLCLRFGFSLRLWACPALS